MNLQYLILEDKATDNEKLNLILNSIAKEIKDKKIKFAAEDKDQNNSKNLNKDKRVILGGGVYYKNVLPRIPATRDLYKKPTDIVNIRVNWKQESFEGLSSDDICFRLPMQYGFCITIVDAGYKRNNYKNSESVWVVFDNKNTAIKHMKVFNKMFRTAIEQDCIDEYKKFKHNIMKRPLTYDKLVPNAYELYDLVDKGEI